MKLISIEVKNFKKLRDFRADFTDGLNTIIGDNWAGKTTLLHAVVTGLYGLTAIPGKKEDIPTWGQKNFKIKMVIEHDGDTYLIERDLRNGKITTGGDEGPEVVASGNTTCTKFIEELLGLAFKDFALFVLSMQGETAGVLTFGATALQRRVEAFSGAEVIDRVVAAVRSRANIMKDRIDQRDPQAIKAEIDRLHEARKTTTSLAEAAREELDKVATEEKDSKARDAKLKEEESSLRDRLARTEHQRRELGSLRTQAAEYQDALRTAEGDLAELPEPPDVEEDEATVADLRKKSKECRKNARQWQAKLDRKAELEAALPDLKEAADEEEELAKKVPSEEQIKTALKADADAYQEVRNLQKEIRKLKQELSDGVCSECHRPFENFDPETIQAKINEAKEALSRAEAVREKTEQEAERLQQLDRKYRHCLKGNKTNAYETALQEYCILDSSLTEIGVPEEAIAEAEAHEKAAYELEAKIAGAEELARKREKLSKRVESLDDKLQSTLLKCEELERTVSSSESPESLGDQLNAVTKQREHLAGRIEELASRHITLAARLKELTIELKEQVENPLERLEQQLADTKAMADDFDRHKRLEKFLVESRTKYLKQVWDQILGVASSKVAISSGGAIRRIARDENGNFVAEENGKWVPIANCSGAQKGHIGVAMRVGLSAALYGNAGLLILDEPTEAMNDHNALQLAGALMGLGGQCVMITHRPFEQLAAQNVIHVGQ